MKMLSFTGSPWQTGQQLGQFGRDAYHKKITRTSLWQRVMALKDSDHARLMQQLTQSAFPAIFSELEGLAEGLDAPFEEVFAWNCRGDLVRSTSDGCTTVAGFSDNGAWAIAHNEDGFPQLLEDCALVTIRPEAGMAFTSFAYPGSLCGHTFAVNEAGLVNTVNNIRALERPAGLPRQVLARAALNAVSLDEALTILTTQPRAGAFHHTLGQMGDRRMFSVEATGSGYSVMEIQSPFGHANHAIHPQLDGMAQVVTASSAARQEQLEAWKMQVAGETLAPLAMQALLSDNRHPQLPIYRLAPDDPDDENTLATALFTLTDASVTWQVWQRDRHIPLLSGTLNAV
ncbi:C45 family autoproteolytic acyltransferase/hydolase [Entomohabitans teleogrylli]|uniref:C45 family autoproteolytic acyltransferase/hydolase n=1 Tax=Entomohabitans teleogrylli TaxID=1384589 RepID=UPI00073D58E8|nr:C45 family peptidase [Entomohabitans teleogrylli]